MTGLTFWWKKYQNIKEILKDEIDKKESVEDCIKRLIREKK